MKYSREYLIKYEMPYTNNWLKLHGYAMIRRPGRRKMTHFEHVNLPFPDLIRKKKRFKKDLRS